MQALGCGDYIFLLPSPYFRVIPIYSLKYIPTSFIKIVVNWKYFIEILLIKNSVYGPDLYCNELHFFVFHVCERSELELLVFV